MKRNTILIGLTIMLGLIISSCTDSDEVNPANQKTKEELRAEVVNLSTAVEAISNSKGFDVITSKGKTKAATEDGEQNVSMKITLDDIKGEYVYQKDASRMKKGGFSDFKKVKDTTLFIMKLPKEIIHKPWRNRGVKTETEEPVNNLMVTTKKYYSEYVVKPLNFNYVLESDIKVDNVDVGTLAVDRKINEGMNIDYNAQFKFPEDYLIGSDLDLSKENVKYEYFLMKGDKALYKEKCAIASSKDSLDFIYSLIIGNIEIKLEKGKYVILRDGKEEKDAKIEMIISENKGEIKVDARFMGVAMLFSSGLDLKVTFANEDVIVLSELIGEETLAKMRQLFGAMYDMYFVKNIVDRVAKQVYFMNKYES